VLQIAFIAASGLSSADRNGLSDPYCTISRNFFTDTKGREIRTKVVRKTLSPEWGEVFEFWTPDVQVFDFQARFVFSFCLGGVL
jgi:Ca2+-dependent lipid-binding protein